MAQPAHTDVNHDVAHHEEHPIGWRRWVYSTNHKDIGTMYLVFALIGGIVGGILSIAMRLELMSPGMQIFSDPEVFNVFVASHGLIMVFFMVMPAMIGGFGNWIVPLMIGAPDMAFPRMNNISFWLLPASFTLLITSLFMPGMPGGNGVGAGWTLYAPLTTKGTPGVAMDFAILINRDNRDTGGETSHGLAKVIGIEAHASGNLRSFLTLPGGRGKSSQGVHRSGECVIGRYGAYGRQCSLF